MSVKLILLVKRLPTLTHEQFRARYESGHAPLARRSLPKLRRYVRNYLSPLSGWPKPEFDCITEFWFDDVDDMEATVRWVTGEEGQILARDEAEFMDRSSMRTFVAEEAMLPGEAP